jgi:hypothetical protein
MKAGLIKRSVQAFHYWSQWVYEACILIPLFYQVNCHRKTIIKNFHYFVNMQIDTHHCIHVAFT